MINYYEGAGEIKKLYFLNQKFYDHRLYYLIKKIWLNLNY